jgi:terminase small subunit-like protein
MKPRKRPIGRPSLFTTELGDEICNRIVDGKSLRAICDEADMPDKATIFRWLSAEQQKDFCKQYVRAREAQADSLVDDILSIADDARNDWMKRNGDNATGYQENGEVLRRSALRIDARKWLAGKMAPKKYGDKQQIEHAGPDGGPVTLEALIMASLKKE